MQCTRVSLLAVQVRWRKGREINPLMIGACPYIFFCFLISCQAQLPFLSTDFKTLYLCGGVWGISSCPCFMYPWFVQPSRKSIMYAWVWVFNYFNYCFQYFETCISERLQSYPIFNRKKRYLLLSKVIVCQSLGRHQVHLLVQEPEEYMLEASTDTGT